MSHSCINCAKCGKAIPGNNWKPSNTWFEGKEDRLCPQCGAVNVFDVEKGYGIKVK